jgi:hypothetical protein
MFWNLGLVTVITAGCVFAGPDPYFIGRRGGELDLYLEEMLAERVSL